MSRPLITTASWHSGVRPPAWPCSITSVYPEYHGAILTGQDFGLLVQRLGDGEARVHLDIHTDDLEAEVDRLEGLGAQRVAKAGHWWVMRDPAGLVFCVIPEPPGSLSDSNAQRWE